METYILESIRPIATRAHSGTSFDPEKRAEQIVKEYSEELTEDLAKIGNDQQYKSRYITLLSAWLSAKSRCLSAMITGPANFPTRRNEKAHRSEDNRYNEFRQWRERALKAIERENLASRTPDQISDDNFKINARAIKSAATTIFGIDNGTERGYSRNLFVSVIIRNVETAARNTDQRRVKKCLDLIRELNAHPLATKPIITDKHKVWQLEHVAEIAREQKVDKAAQVTKEVPFDGGILLINYGIDRVQIKHDQKPPFETIKALKKNAFKWSPSQGLWQRQLTNNALCAAHSITKIELEKLK